MLRVGSCASVRVYYYRTTLCTLKISILQLRGGVFFFFVLIIIRAPAIVCKIFIVFCCYNVYASYDVQYKYMQTLCVYLHIIIVIIIIIMNICNACLLKL